MAKGLTSFFNTPILDRVFQEPLIFYTVLQKAQVMHFYHEGYVEELNICALFPS